MDEAAPDAHLECSSGVSGDMWLGALVDAGASIESIQSCVDRLGVGDVRLTVGRVRRAGIPAMSVRVRPPQETRAPRSWPDLRSILEDADLPPAVRDRSHAVLRRLVEAEATVQGVAVDDVSFHAIGALDTLGDVVGTCAGVADLGLGRITVGPIATGSGTVETVAGPLALPRRTVQVLLRGYELVATDVAAELVTPTGAALTAELTTPGPTPAASPDREGVGAGAHDLPTPNVLRLVRLGAR